MRHLSPGTFAAPRGLPSFGFRHLIRLQLGSTWDASCLLNLLYIYSFNVPFSSFFRVKQWHTIPSPCKLRDGSGLHGLKCLEDANCISWTVLAYYPIKGAQNKAKNKAKRLLGTKHVAWFPLCECMWMQSVWNPESPSNRAASCAAAEQALPVQLSFASPGLGIAVNEQKTARRRLETKTRYTQRTSKNWRQKLNRPYIENNDGIMMAGTSPATAPWQGGCLEMVSQSLSVFLHAAAVFTGHRGHEGYFRSSFRSSSVPSLSLWVHLGFTANRNCSMDLWVWAFAHPGRSQAPELNCARATCKLLQRRHAKTCWSGCEGTHAPAVIGMEYCTSPCLHPQCHNTI